MSHSASKPARRPASIAVLGSANMDLVVVADRAPGMGETVTGREFRTVPGGKGANQALAAARAGAAVTLLGAVGDDEFGRRISGLLAADGIDLTGLAVTATPTGTAHITVDGSGDNSIVVVPGANGTVAALTDGHRSAIAAANVLLLQLELPLPVVAEAAAHARQSGVYTVLTPAPAVPLPAGLLADVDLLVANEHEVAIVAGEPPDSTDPTTVAARLAQAGPDVVVTMGANGALSLANDAAPVPVPAFRVDAVDTTAAGDTFVGVLATAVAERREWPDALRLASAAAALAVQRFGASSSMPSRAEVEQFLAAQRRSRTGRGLIRP